MFRCLASGKRPEGGFEPHIAGRAFIHVGYYHQTILGCFLLRSTKTLARQKRFELPTTRLEGAYSIQLSYWHKIMNNIFASGPLPSSTAVYYGAFCGRYPPLGIPPNLQQVQL